MSNSIIQKIAPPLAGIILLVAVFVLAVYKTFEPTLKLARVGRVEADFQSCEIAITSFYRYVKRLPSSEEGFEMLITKPKDFDSSFRWMKILDKVPVDPGDANTSIRCSLKTIPTNA